MGLLSKAHYYSNSIITMSGTHVLIVPSQVCLLFIILWHRSLNSFASIGMLAVV